VTAIPAPTSPIADSAVHAGDEPIGDVLQRLDRRVAVRAPRPVGSFFAALFTLGLWPLLQWPHRGGEFIEEQQADLVGLAAWWRRRVPLPAVRKLDRAVEDLQTPVILLGMPTVIFWFIAAVFAVTIYQHGLNIEYLRLLTFDWDHRGRHWLTSLDNIHLHNLWLGALFVGYTSQWLAVRRHRSAVRSIMTIAHRASGGFGRPMGRDALDGGLSVMWIIAALIFCANSAWWGIPFALAGAAQQRYTQAGTVVRGALASQVRGVLHGGGDLTETMPATAVFQPATTGRFCKTRGCGSRLPAVASYCPRCGAKV
jgi:hypothetical protein